MRLCLPLPEEGDHPCDDEESDDDEAHRAEIQVPDGAENPVVDVEFVGEDRDDFWVPISSATATESPVITML
ncbi:unnamed protein product, partial [Mesorhabditis spiculigera]